jgi:hypothetical protein
MQVLEATESVSLRTTNSLVLLLPPSTVDYQLSPEGEQVIPMVALVTVKDRTQVVR